MPHITPSGHRSNAWKALEYRVAELFREAGFTLAQRIIPDAKQKMQERPDVDVPEIPELAVDTKYKGGGWHHHTVFEEEVTPYVGALRLFGKALPYSWAIMPTRSGNSDRIYVTLRIEAFLDLLRKIFLRTGSGADWACPRCPEAVLATGVITCGLHEYKCCGCQLVFLCQERPAPRPEPKANKRKRPKGQTIKGPEDHSEPPAGDFKPLQGQQALLPLQGAKK